MEDFKSSLRALNPAVQISTNVCASSGAPCKIYWKDAESQKEFSTHEGDSDRLALLMALSLISSMGVSGASGAVSLVPRGALGSSFISLVPRGFGGVPGFESLFFGVQGGMSNGGRDRGFELFDPPAC